MSYTFTCTLAVDRWTLGRAPGLALSFLCAHPYFRALVPVSLLARVRINIHTSYSRYRLCLIFVTGIARRHRVMRIQKAFREGVPLSVPVLNGAAWRQHVACARAVLLTTYKSHVGRL
jgi:hypothetical protein